MLASRRKLAILGYDPQLACANTCTEYVHN